MKHIIELETEDLEDANTLQWVIDKHRWQNTINAFTEYLLKKYKHGDPVGTEAEQDARLLELEEIREMFWDIVKENQCNTEFL